MPYKDPIKQKEFQRRYRTEHQEKYNKYQREWRKINQEKYRKSSREFTQNKRRINKKYHQQQIEYRKKYYLKNRKKICARRRRDYKLHPIEMKCRRLFRTAVQNGNIIRPTICSNCHKIGVIQAHHSDYSKPLKVIWLCVLCHMSLHQL